MSSDNPTLTTLLLALRKTMTNLLPSRYALFNEFERLLNDSDLGNRIPLRTSSLVCHVSGEENSAIVDVEIPGVEPSEVKVKIEGRSLFVTTPKGDAHVTLGQRLDADNATASIKHGLLTVTIPKREAKTVEVTVLEG